MTIADVVWQLDGLSLVIGMIIGALIVLILRR